MQWKFCIRFQCWQYLRLVILNIFWWIWEMMLFYCHFRIGKFPKKSTKPDQNFGNENWIFFRFFHTIFERFPFSWKDPIGYLIAFTLQSVSILDLFFFVSCCVSLGIGIYMVVTSLTEDIKIILNSINENAKFKRNRLKLSKEIYNALEFHATAMRLNKCVDNFIIPFKCDIIILFDFRLVRDTSAVAQPIFMILFSWSCITICGGFLIITMGLVSYYIQWE